MTDDQTTQNMTPGHQPIDATELSGTAKGWGVEIGERSECPDSIAVSAQDIPGLLTWLTQEWAKINKEGTRSSA